jgi:hypothetical protein
MGTDVYEWCIEADGIFGFSIANQERAVVGK